MLCFDVYDIFDEFDVVYFYEVYVSDEVFVVYCEGFLFKQFVDYVVLNVIATMDLLLWSVSLIAINVVG